MKSSQIWDTYLYGDSKRSDMRTDKPLAKSSNVSAVGDVFPLMILCMVDLGTPVLIDT